MRAVLLVAVLAPAVCPALVHAEKRCADIQMTPSEDLQMVAWVETAAGAYVDTIYITQTTGRYGLGNRPGRFDFNSGPMWPYGRRKTTFPVWSHRHGLTFPSVIQSCCNSVTMTTDDPDYCNTLINDSNQPPPFDRAHSECSENDLSHAFNQSSRESRFCQPLMETDPKWVQADAMTCATIAFTDKGKLSTKPTSLYPPRTDVMRGTADSPSVDMYRMMNPFDAVSRATPAGGAPTAIVWPISEALAPGSYVLWFEVNKERDHNGTYSTTAYPSLPASGPKAIQWSGYGVPYRGQPSVLYKTPFTISTDITTASTDTYVGYGDPEGDDGTVRPPDATITTDTPGSGAARLQLVSDGGSMYRVRMTVRPNVDITIPEAPRDLRATAIDTLKITLAFTAPSAGGQPVAGYEVRYRVNSELTVDNFDASIPAATSVTPVDPGKRQELELTSLLPETDYYVGVRAFDGCRNLGDISIIKVTTADRVAGEVDACFVATAAYGSMMAHDVELLRHFRDSILDRTVFGELAIQGYYTFGPALAGVIGESDLLRASVRELLWPLVRWVQTLKF